MTRLQCFCLGAGLQRDRENNNKALVHKGSTPLIQMFFDVSEITVFQSPNPFTQKSNEECFKILLREIALQEQAQTQHRDFLSFPNRGVAKGFCFSALDRFLLKSLLLYKVTPSSVQEVQTMPAFSSVMTALAMSCDKSSKLLAKDRERGSHE